MLWPLQQGANGNSEGGAVTADSGLTTITAPSAGSENTKGSWVELHSATPYEVGLVVVNFDHITGTVYRGLVDIGIGAASSEVVVIPDLLAVLQSTAGGSELASPLTYIFPVRIPVGSRVAARWQASVADVTIDVGVALIGVGPLCPAPFNRVTAYGIVSASSEATAADPGGSANTKTLTEIEASTANPCRAIVAAITGDQDGGTWRNADYLFDITAGPSANEIVVAPNIHSNQTTIESWPSAYMGPYPCDLPAGTRLGVDLQCSTNNAADRVAQVALYGLD